MSDSSHNDSFAFLNLIGAGLSLRNVRAATMPDASIKDYISGAGSLSSLTQLASTTALGKSMGLNSYLPWLATRKVNNAVWTAKSIEHVFNPQPLDWLQMPVLVNNMVREVDWSLRDLGALVPSPISRIVKPLLAITKQ